MNYIKLLLLAFLFSSFDGLATEEKFGIVTSQNGVLCASFGENTPAIGSVVKIVETQSPQYFIEGKLAGETEACKALESAEVLGPYFIVTSIKKIAEPFVGVVVLSKKTLSVVNNEVQLGAPDFKERIYFRSCTSNEGLHFSSWLGQPLDGAQLWSAYYYLGSDIEPSCDERDFKK